MYPGFRFNGHKFYSDCIIIRLGTSRACPVSLRYSAWQFWGINPFRSVNPRIHPSVRPWQTTICNRGGSRQGTLGGPNPPASTCGTCCNRTHPVTLSWCCGSRGHPYRVGLKSDGTTGQTTGHLAARGSASRYMARRARRKATRQVTELTMV